MLDALIQIAKREPRSRGGLLLFIDEMGKFLEGAVRDGEDIYFFQQLAELASRSDRRLIVVGILHQAFEEYAHRLSREMRDEWSKIQGRYVDIPVAVGPDEQLEILGRAIESDSPPHAHWNLVCRIAELAGKPDAARTLEACWPLHPVVASLLGPISRRRFGQNQRSVFGFLNSAEPLGFQDFLRDGKVGDLYMADRLWDYLRINLEPSILASADGHRWALTVDALNRCEATGADEVRMRLLKTIALIDLFKERSGLVAGIELLHLTAADVSEDETTQALADLQRLSLVVYRRFSDSYSVFAGSDFDIEQAIEEAYGEVGRLSHERLTQLAALPPVIAKRHYHETGALRWYRFAVSPPGELSDAVAAHAPLDGSAGAFILTLPIEGDSPADVEGHVVDAMSSAVGYDPALGVPDQEAWTVSALARDLLALEHVRRNSPLLHGDQVARLEVEGRITAVREQLEHELARALQGAWWRTRTRQARRLDQSQLNLLASELSDNHFPDAPRLANELLNRMRPSSNAVAAQNVLLSRMVVNEGEERLGIDGHPAEGGLFVSLLERTDLYRSTSKGWRFASPDSSDPQNLGPAWATAEELLAHDSQRTVSVSELWAKWREPPLGIKDGLMPVLTAAFVLSMRKQVALYRDGLFQARVTDVDLHVMARNPGTVHLRWMVLSEANRDLLSDLAELVRSLDHANNLADLEPLDVARGLVRLYDRLPNWTRRTQRLSADARLLRQLLNRANDPNKLLFDDIPRSYSSEGAAAKLSEFSHAARRVGGGLRELHGAYPAMLNRQQEALLSELQVPNASEPMLAELRARAENVRGLGADHRQEAFTVRLAQFRGTEADIEGLVSLAVSKPPANWADTDVDAAELELAQLARVFVRGEAFAHVKGRTDKRHAIAVIVGKNGRATPLHREFHVLDVEQPAIDGLADRIDRFLASNEGHSERLVLAALAELSARRIRAD
ncbi:MAG: ATP-binding protein [Chloroflexi bacterium]|nr:ATP-binding protein [Chloroflexota bacterium]